MSQFEQAVERYKTYITTMGDCECRSLGLRRMAYTSQSLKNVVRLLRVISLPQSRHLSSR